MKNILTKCCYCGKPITIYAPGPEEDRGQFSCNVCIHENSAARDNINESMWTEAKKTETRKPNIVMAAIGKVLKGA